MACNQPPDPRANVQQLKRSLVNVMVQFSGGAIQNYEPPNDLTDILILALHSRGVKAEERVKFLNAVEIVASSNPSTNPVKGTMKETLSQAENEGLLDNVGDVFGALVNLDIGKAVEETVDLVGDFFEGFRLPF